MKDKFLVSIKGIQEYDNAEDNSDISLIAEAEFQKQDGVYFIDYQESEITGLDGTNTSIEIGNDYVSLLRNGAVNSQMLFMKEKKTSSYYSTPYGNFMVGIYTDNLNIDIDDNGGTVNVDYYLDINNSKTSKNNFEIKIRRHNI